MTGPPMWSRRAEFSRRAVRWLWPAALLALTPKCVLCVLAYAGVGAALGLGGAEFCGGSAGPRDAWASSLAWLGGIGGFVAMVIHLGERRRHASSPATGREGCHGDQ